MYYQISFRYYCLKADGWVNITIYAKTKLGLVRAFVWETYCLVEHEKNDGVRMPRRKAQRKLWHEIKNSIMLEDLPNVIINKS